MRPTCINPQSGTSFRLSKNDELTVRSPTGLQVADLFCFSQTRPLDALSSGRTIDYNETLLFSKGHTLFSNAGLPLLDIIEDTCGRNDFLVTPCSLQMFQMLSKTKDYHPSCHQNLSSAFAPFNRHFELISTTFNIFMNIEFDQSGKIRVGTPLNKPTDFIVFRACEDLLVGLTACADQATNSGTCKPIEYSVS
ncbi:MAG: urea carboxylase-associated family protein [Pseudomonadota bacterium]|nr:urea carboxylase-associated family protein [Pseudomonadota bacterium]